MKGNMVQKVSDFLRVENGRIDAGSSVILGGIAASTLLVGVLSGKAEARPCCSDTCNSHGDIHTNGYDPHTNVGHKDGIHSDHTNGSPHTNSHAECW